MTPTVYISTNKSLCKPCVQIPSNWPLAMLHQNDAHSNVTQHNRYDHSNVKCTLHTWMYRMSHFWGVILVRRAQKVSRVKTFSLTATQMFKLTTPSDNINKMVLGRLNVLPHNKSTKRKTALHSYRNKKRKSLHKISKS